MTSFAPLFASLLDTRCFSHQHTHTQRSNMTHKPWCWMPDASIDDTLADPPDCPKAPCPSSANDGLPTFSLACLSRNQQSSNVPSCHRGSHWHTRDLMTSPGPCKSKTGDPTSRARALGKTSFGAGPNPRCSQPHRANGQHPQARGLPKAVVQRGATASELPQTGCPCQPDRPGCEGEAQGKVQASSSCQSLPHQLEETKSPSFSKGLALGAHLFAFFLSFVHTFTPSSFLSSLAASKVICLIQDMSCRNSKLMMQVSPWILHGLWGPLHRMADASRSLPRSCFSRPSATFPFCLCYRDLPSPLLLCSPSLGYPDKTAERL